MSASSKTNTVNISTSVKSSVLKQAVRRLSQWYLKNARDLPWRSRSFQSPQQNQQSPYYIWLSEVMLQQTQVTTVIPYYEKFLKYFPTVQDLAQAPESQVLKLWAGLGYYSRAKRLHEGAKVLTSYFKNHPQQPFPTRASQWLEIPGVGPYTAGAIASIGFEERVAAVDGNVIRVLSRLFALKKLSPQYQEIWSLAQSMVALKEAKPSVLNQAFMELGATVCKPKNPQCHLCPWNEICLGKKNHELYPPKKKRKAKVLVQEKRIMLVSFQKEIKIALVKNSANSKWRKGLYDFPEVFPKIVSKKTQAKWVMDHLEKYTVTHHQVERTVKFFASREPVAQDAHSNVEWFSVKHLPALPAPTLRTIQACLPVLKKVKSLKWA